MIAVSNELYDKNSRQGFKLLPVLFLDSNGDTGCVMDDGNTYQADLDRYTHMHTYTQTYIHKNIYADIHTSIHTDIYVHRHMCTRTDIHTAKHTHTERQIHTYM